METKLTPTKTTFNTDPNDPIIDISCGANHSLCLLASGTIYAWGYNGVGQLGNGNNNSSQPKKITYNFKHRIVSIACGYNISLAVTEQGHVYSWGSNVHGELGLGDGTNRNYPEEIESLNIFQKNSLKMDTNLGIMHLSQDLKEMWQSEFLTDEVICCNDGTEIRIHKALVKLRCPKLLLPDEFDISRYSTASLKIIIEYIYTDDIDDFQLSLAGELLHACKILELKRLTEILRKYWSENITDENVIELIDIFQDDKSSVLKNFQKYVYDRSTTVSSFREYIDKSEYENMDCIKLSTYRVPHTQLDTDMARILYEGDFTIIIGDQKIKAHKFILSRLPYFKKLFKTELADKERLVHETPLPALIFYGLLEFLYTGNTIFTLVEASWLVEESVVELYGLNFDYFLDSCKEKLSERITKRNCVEVFRSAMELGREDLIEEAKTLIEANKAYVMRDFLGLYATEIERLTYLESQESTLFEQQLNMQHVVQQMEEENRLLESRIIALEQQKQSNNTSSV
eukprot:TRINITY_DN5318_c0_g1_i2.p2 TRINITY_DN5318_c0_g1~~TRINITY_DN5318_c0_g1_i2.p2  ORF type:complete len:515 (-),score=96.81 TRINITY_DN5318_c0_g1_i2:1810-3354(-)